MATGESMIVAETPTPRSRATLAADLRGLGIASGMALLVHSSLRRLGWVSGGPVAVVQALLDVLAPAGTLVMPTHTSDNSEPSFWRHPPVPEEWWPTIRNTMPAYDPVVTPTTQMGKIVEVFRTWPGTLRSAHPQVSFAAHGPQAGYITAGHTLADGLGESSPLARVYDLDGYVLLLGVSHANNTSFHLGEYRAPGGPRMIQGAAIMENGQRMWKTFSDLDWDSDPFPDIGARFDATSAVRFGIVGGAEARVFRQRAAVDFAQESIAEIRATE